MTDRIVLQGVRAHGFHGVLDSEKVSCAESHDWRTVTRRYRLLTASLLGAGCADGMLSVATRESLAAEAFRKLRARSHETENKLRADVNKRLGRWQYSYGLMAQYVQYDNRYFRRLRRRSPLEGKYSR